MSISNATNGLRSGVCTSTTRPTTPYEGQVIYETDTDLIKVWNGSSWVATSSPAYLTISPSGYVNMPSQPIISGQIGSFGSITADQLVPFDDFWVSRGITYNSSTRRFTVPTTGIYRITMNPFFQNGVTNCRVLVGIDTDAPTATLNRGHSYRESATYDTGCINSVVSINSGSYIVFRLFSGTLYNASNDRFNQFSIEMIC